MEEVAPTIGNTTICEELPSSEGQTTGLKIEQVRRARASYEQSNHCLKVKDAHVRLVAIVVFSISNEIGFNSLIHINCIQFSDCLGY